MVAILEEIQSLWEEVVPVAHMAAEKQLLGPILRRFDLSEERRSLQQDVICDYVSSTPPSIYNFLLTKNRSALAWIS